MYVLNQDAIKRLNRMLNLPALGNEQDWEFELADSDRIEEFLDLIKFAALTVEEKVALLALILSSAEDATNKDQNIDKYLGDLVSIISKDKNIFSEVLDYWASVGSNESVFRKQISKIIRGC